MTAAADFLKKCREKAGLSQEKLAELLNWNQSDISKVERGKKGIDIKTYRDWTVLTNHMDLGITFLYNLDPASLLQMAMQMSGAAFFMALWV